MKNTLLDSGLRRNDKRNMKHKKAIAILGPTASGKTKLAVKLAAELDGEIISADSRQVYRGLDIGSGKDLAEYQIGDKNIPYHLIDVADPQETFDLAQWQEQARAALADITKRKKLPIVVGGTGLYLQALVDNYQLSTAQADEKLREQLSKLSIDELLKKIGELNKKFLEKINESDKHNQRRLLRYLEVLQQGGRIDQRQPSDYNWLLIGLNLSKEILAERIERRLIERLDQQDMVGEVQRLAESGLSWQRLESFGLEYKYIAQYLQEKLDYEQMKEKIKTASQQLAKRQMSWYKRWQKQGTKIFWSDDYQEILAKIKEFLN